MGCRHQAPPEVPLRSFVTACPEVFGQGYGTEITRLVVDHTLDTCGSYPVSPGVYDFNPRAQRVYQKCGFRREGRRQPALL